MIDTDAKEIRALVPYAKAVLSNNCLCVVGNENKIKENSSLFTTGTIIVVCYTGKENKYGKTEKINALLHWSDVQTWESPR